MGLFRALIVLVVGMFTMTAIDEQNSKLNNIPLVKSLLGNKIKENKCMVIIIVLALVEFIL